MQNIRQMFAAIKEDVKYGEIFKDDRFYADNEETYKYIVDVLANISFQDSELDAKGSAFEYFVKFNLRGSKLGQYFTPREVVNLMVDFVDIDSLIYSLPDPVSNPKVIDPACGSGGFLIMGLQRIIEKVKKLNLPRDQEEKMINRAKNEVFWGCDANPTIARTAKMNMVIAGDGSSNIKKGNSLTEEIEFLRIRDSQPTADFILANPPFGMSESRLPEEIVKLYDVHTSKGQALFIQKMIKLTKPGGRVCTVVDEGILNNPTMEDLRKYILTTCFIDAVVSLPLVTFKPNYTNVKTSFLLLTKKEHEIERQSHPIFMCDIKVIGYDSSYKLLKPSSAEINEGLHEEFRKFQEGKVHYKNEIKKSFEKEFLDDNIKTCFQLTVDEVELNYKFRLDVRFNHPRIVRLIHDLNKAGAEKIKDLLREPIFRGNTTPNTEQGIPAIKVRNIKKNGIDWNTDFVSEEYYERAQRSGKTVKQGDVLIASTGGGR